MLAKIIHALEKLKNPQKACGLQRFFKTGKGEYGEGDVFWGVTVPKQREVAKHFKEASLQDIESLLHSKVHEYRLTALIMLVMKYKLADRHRGLSLRKTIPSRCHSGESRNLCKQIFQLYLKNTKWINNWDLVDLSAPSIVGEYLYSRCVVNRRNEACLVPTTGNEKQIIYKLAHSSFLWERRIAIIATFTFIRKNEFAPTLKIAKILLHDKHDLIHKAVGWMLREVGKRDEKILIGFLNKYYKKMPRVMLRYAIEELDKMERKEYLS